MNNFKRVENWLDKLSDVPVARIDDHLQVIKTRGKIYLCLNVDNICCDSGGSGDNGISL